MVVRVTLTCLYNESVCDVHLTQILIKCQILLWCEIFHFAFQGDLMLVKYVGENCTLVRNRYVGEELCVLVKKFHQHSYPWNGWMLVKVCWGKVMLAKKFSMLVKLYVGEDKTQSFALSKTCMLVKIFHQHTDFYSPT